MRPSVEQDKIDLPERDALAEILVTHTCLRKCYGQDAMAAACCTLGERDFIIGPIPDWQDLLVRLSDHFGRPVPFEEVFVSYEEGRKLFPDRKTWQRKKSYPALRPDLDAEALPCRFLGEDNLCTIHEIRSTTCRSYFCPHLHALLKQL